MTQETDFALSMADEIEKMVERAEELQSAAIEFGFTACGHKLEEAFAPLSSAATAARQYAAGVLVATP